MSTHVAPVHSVHIYDDNSSLISRLCAISAAGLRIGDAVIVIATRPHRDQLVRCLRDRGIDLPKHARQGRFKMFDAEETLSMFMGGGSPDCQRFTSEVGTILQDAQKVSRSKGRGLTVFGEMVSVLWDQGNKEGALKLEELWNDILNERAFHLHCAYPRFGLINGDVSAVCRLHSYAIVDTGEMAA